ncbi:hypothetical protein GCM10022225_04840 [Plantactinospora mayteni]|uniref:Uncharacterized protein n=1 Tax=Plantactinospora mayteni TaxID=566021 RepID=A0ABQ4EQP1_9ACTN|nr:hypothetical protein Pma05_35460 [Plantactinospora mayteni]
MHTLPAPAVRRAYVLGGGAGPERPNDQIEAHTGLPYPKSVDRSELTGVQGATELVTFSRIARRHAERATLAGTRVRSIAY